MPHLKLTWACLGNDADGAGFSARLQLLALRDLPAGGWALYFNTCRPPDLSRLAGEVRLRHPGGDLFCLEPAASFAGLPEGQVLEIGYWSAGYAISVTDAPLGFYLVLDGEVSPLGDPLIEPFVTAAQLHRGAGDLVPASTPASRYAAQAEVGSPEALQPFTPAPLSWQPGEGGLRLEADMQIVYQDGLASEARLLQALLREQHALALECVTEAGSNGIALRMGEPGLHAATHEGYRLEITAHGAVVCGAGAHGVANGIQSLLQMLSPAATLPLGEVLDAPRYAYRGLMLDVARHFVGKQSVLRLLDDMARYKLNTLHLHLSDDEGWRVEIAALPELTEVGGQRGYAQPQEQALCASFGSGPDAATSAGSGFYSRADFIDILRHARQRHITVLPEIDVPGHARAAIKSMDARYRRLMAQGQPAEAEEYLLSDPDDHSVYQSVQLWRDNVMCVAQPGCLRFVATVLGELRSMYAEAGAPLTTVHTGGDEVPDGAWLASPLCRALMAQHGLQTTAQVQEYFFGRLRTLVHGLDLQLAGWEEMATIDGKDGKPQPNPRFLDAPVRSYVWHSAWGKGREDLAYQLANAGYPVVLCNADRLYLDLACAKDPAEPGYYWGGFPDLRHVLEFCPEDIYRNAPYDLMGQAVDAEALSNMVLLTATGRRNLLGIQAHLWGENVRSVERMDYLLFPRLLAVAECAWCERPAMWAEFAHRLTCHALPQLDRLGVLYRLPPPGVQLSDGMVRINSELPGLTLRYTLDGREPDEHAAQYTQPFALPSAVRELRVAAFSSTGRKGRSSVLSWTG
ncbi:family 20 glycosylhydrolase [Duganella sp. CY15W]|uniref:family 20 glycosylhydrolase n=1 Tax=Duganella sp. CY15W TaxID=2692172 RepID=UPI00136FD840|nr:family 20 glycosylhydrolase [Duganella sp. CY15W]MYM32710.1 family 20 glycosylhydrolase [Duganella sp. CY15W]